MRKPGMRMVAKRLQVPVIFRRDRNDPADVFAVFPTLAANPGHMLMYQHVGQHGEVPVAYYQTTRATKPAQYEALLRELRRIYEDVDLVVYERLQKRWPEGTVDERERT